MSERDQALAIYDERERCARAIEDMAIALRDNGPKTPEGLLTALAGAQVGALLDAAASLQLARDPSRWDDRHPYRPNRKYPWFCEECGYPEHERLKHGPQEEDGYPGSLLPPGWPKRGAP